MEVKDFENREKKNIVLFGFGGKKVIPKNKETVITSDTSVICFFCPSNKWWAIIILV